MKAWICLALVLLMVAVSMAAPRPDASAYSQWGGYRGVFRPDQHPFGYPWAGYLGDYWGMRNPGDYWGMWNPGSPTGG